MDELLKELKGITLDLEEKIGMPKTLEKLNEIRVAVTPKKGVDYFTEQEKKEFLKEATPIKGLHYFDGEKGDKGDPGKNGSNGRDGTDGKDGAAPSREEILGLIRPLIPAPIQGERGKDGKDGVDAELTPQAILEAIQGLSEKDSEEFAKKIGSMIDVSYLRNAQSFLFNGKRYKTEELMHGGGSTASGGTTYLTPAGAVDASNQVFTVVDEPTSVISDGITYFDGAGYVYASLTVTMDIPPSQYIRYTI